MSEINLGTPAQNTWCPGCGNFAIMNAIKAVLTELSAEGVPLENIVLVSGIGCHAKIVDYLNVNSFYSIHGRATPAAEGIKLANPKIKVICFAGDGDAYGEGIEHLIFAAKRNIDITMIIHNNRVYGLTTGQYTPTSPTGFKGRSTPQGTKEPPINPLELMLASNASFLARGTSHGMELLKKIFKEAILHRGFSLVDVLQVCVTYFNMYEYYDKRVYEIKDHDAADYNQALQKVREWDYNADKPIALGVIYKKDAPVFEEKLTARDTAGREAKIRGILKTFI
ncbi:MAG: thiamine pyrophosphate-dependent enzyme [Candidatus Omnitrophica bacterium]|nr:thiamine pyrophosphate-dependent enzyme [Candidatus Omnitrophota bacterium]MDD5610632.1 thiamine pyrophosphate-dependent enzyme [Candidatus Omnitrophota bacterium]